jgi:hypothetical protein
MARLPFSVPHSRQKTISDAKIVSVFCARDEALRDLEAAEQDNDLERVAKARQRVREAQGIINRFGLET